MCHCPYCGSLAVIETVIVTTNGCRKKIQQRRCIKTRAGLSRSRLKPDSKLCGRIEYLNVEQL